MLDVFCLFVLILNSTSLDMQASLELVCITEKLVHPGGLKIQETGKFMAFF